MTDWPSLDRTTVADKDGKTHVWMERGSINSRPGRDRKYNCRPVVNAWRVQLSPLGMLRSRVHYVDPTHPRRIYNIWEKTRQSTFILRWREAMTIFRLSFLVVSGFRLGHHHLAELIKVHWARAVLQRTDNILVFCWLEERHFRVKVRWELGLFCWQLPRPTPQWFLPAPRLSEARVALLCETSMKIGMLYMFVFWPMRPLSVSVVMNPWPSLSYTLKASFSSFFIVSMSGSSTRKVAHSWQNSPG